MNGALMLSPVISQSYRNLDLLKIVKLHFIDDLRWTLDNGIDEHRLYEITKLRLQYRSVFFSFRISDSFSIVSVQIMSIFLKDLISNNR